jgi:hypothetical protein
MQKGGLAGAGFARQKDAAVGMSDIFLGQLQFGIGDVHVNYPLDVDPSQPPLELYRGDAWLARPATAQPAPENLIDKDNSFHFRTCFVFRGCVTIYQHRFAPQLMRFR